jgi:lipid II:glycine glycyltransferase (peptidoglycan interpeptide bridge formation enzyme)
MLAGSAFRLWIARVGGEPAAAILVIQDREAHYTRGAMDERLAGPTSANYLLHSLAIREACQAGCHHYHMGETGGSSSLAQFKSRFGAVAISYAEYRFERLPISWIDERTRDLVKRVIGFRDV